MKLVITLKSSPAWTSLTICASELSAGMFGGKLDSATGGGMGCSSARLMLAVVAVRAAASAMRVWV